MAFSRRAFFGPSSIDRVLSVLAALMLSFCVVALSPVASFAQDEESGVLCVESIQVDGLGFSSSVDCAAEETLQLPRFCPVRISANCTPSSIDAGVDCGMEWMCGISPCLCGSADSWGGCSCNGLSSVSPALTYACDESCVALVEAFGSYWLIPLGSGSASLDCSASLRYFADAQQSVPIEVGGLCAADALFALVVVFVIAIAVFFVMSVRALVRRLASSGQEEDA